MNGVNIFPDLTTFPKGSNITISCANHSLALASDDKTATCEANKRWSFSAVPACVLCSSDSQCSGKANNICDRETWLCTCQPGTEFYFDRCIVKVTIETILILDGDFREEYNNSDSMQFKNFETEICEALGEALQNREYSLLVSGFLECSISSFTTGSIIATLLTSYNEEQGVTAKLLDDIINVTAEDQTANYSLPGVRYNFTTAPVSRVITLNPCQEGQDVCDPDYGVCHYLEGSNYTCSCRNAYDKYPSSESIYPGVSCFVTSTPNLVAIGFLSLTSGIVLFLCIAFVFLVLHPWPIKEKLTVNKINIDKNSERKLNDGENFDIIRGIPTQTKLPYDEEHWVQNTAYITSESDTIDPFVKDADLEEKERAIARIIENMGGVPQIPRVSRVDLH
ncbi:hypothetical protein HOLleu_31443 [Holothuria leucospilota]|uniref:Sushi domain-containing protein n=1 Tax=Holothuria leucospilota TaxID=206669 RepID=A0A9Q1BHB1_HOLLE|nr:hypothetical protein HOLleu_31443 [Holothuria leucospilota]